MRICFTGDLSFGIARVDQALIDNSGIYTEVFRRIEEASAWLDIELGINIPVILCNGFSADD
jgi:hypothetical protein